MASVQQAGWDTTVKSNRLFYPASWLMLFIGWLPFVVDVFMRYNIPTAIPYLRKEFGWSALVVGWVDSAYIWTYALSQVPWGYVSERWLGARRTVALGTAMMVVASLAFAFHVENVPLAILSRAVIGMGAGAVGVALNPLFARWFAPPVRGLQTGLWATGSAVGTGLGGALMPILLTGTATLFGLSALQSGFLYSALPGIAVIVLILVFLRDRPEDVGLVSLDAPRRHASSPRRDEPGFGDIMRGSIYPYLLAITYAGFIGAKYFVWTWFAVFLAFQFHLNPMSAGFIWAFVAAVPPVLMQPVGGWLSDRLGRVRCIVVALLANAALAGILALISFSGEASSPLWLLITIAGLFGVTTNLWVMVWPLTTVMFPTATSGPIGGFMNTFAQLIGALAPVVSGFFIDLTGGYTAPFVAGCLCALIAAGCASFLKDERVV